MSPREIKALKRELLELRRRCSLHGPLCSTGCKVKTVENDDECDGYLYSRLTALGSE